MDRHLTDVVDLLNFLFQNGAPPSLGTRCVRIPDCPTHCPI